MPTPASAGAPIAYRLPRWVPALIVVTVGLLAGCGDATGSMADATAKPTRSVGPALTPVPTAKATQVAPPSLQDESPYGVFPISLAAVLATLKAEFPTMTCDDERIWDSLEPADDGTPWRYLACSIGTEAVMQFITDPDGRLRSASSISIYAARKDLPVLAALVAAAAGSVGEAIFPRLQAALDSGEDSVLTDGGYRFSATSPLSSWMVDVTAIR